MDPTPVPAASPTKKIVLTQLLIPGEGEFRRLMRKEAMVVSTKLDRSNGYFKITHSQKLTDYVRVTGDCEVDMNLFMSQGFYNLGASPFGYYIFVKAELEEMTEEREGEIARELHYYLESNGHKRLWKNVFIIEPK